MNDFFKPKRAWAIARKEFYHIMRDKFTLTLALGLPLLVVFIFGLAMEFNQKDIPTSIYNQDKSQTSRRLGEMLSGSNYFIVDPVFNFYDSFYRLESEQSKAVLIIPPHFEKDLIDNHGGVVQVLVNAADNQSAAAVISYLGQIEQRANNKMLKNAPHVQSLQFITRFLFNPDLNSQWFSVPGLMVIITTMIAILLTSLTVAREWEFGSMELLLSTPVQPLEIIIGKISPYALICLVSIFIVYFCARVIFHIPFAGNLLVYAIGSFLFIVTYLAQGLMISVLTRKQMLAMQFSMLSGLLPSQLLSGFIFPVENMPPFFQKLTMLLPARWYMEISRKSFLQGSTFWQLRIPMMALTILMILFSLVALKKFKKDLDP